jgi:hypothetical protein
MRLTVPPGQSHASDKRSTPWAERLLLGALFGLALFSVEAGLAHIALGRDAVCRESLSSARVAPADGSGCMSELARTATNALARGPAGVLLQEKMTLASWALSILVYAILGGACAQLRPGQAVLTYLGIHAFVVLAVSFILFIGPHIVA